VTQHHALLLTRAGTFRRFRKMRQLVALTASKQKGPLLMCDSSMQVRLYIRAAFSCRKEELRGCNQCSGGRHIFVRCLVISLKPDVSWVPAQCHALGIFTDCRLLRTCHCESAGRIYRKSAFLSACTPSCQQIGANPNRLRLPRDCRTACSLLCG